MRPIRPTNQRPSRKNGPAAFLLLAALAGTAVISPGARADSASDHRAGMATLTDLKAAITSIVQANDSFATDRNVYHRASQRAINALEGTHGPDYRPAAGTPGDALGAIGHIDALLHRKGTPVWAAPLDSAEANMRAAAAYLLDASHARSLIRFQLATSRALTYLEVARGRPTEVGALGGMEGTLANTVLGVPAGAAVENGCSRPSSAPSYGVHGGYLAWIAVPASAGTHSLGETSGGHSLIVEHGVIVLPTAAAALVAKACRTHAAATPEPAPRNTAGPAAIPAMAIPTPANRAPPALYTKAQAAAGARLFAVTCVACHGANLQGTAAPAVAGTDFLKTVEKNGWTLEALRYLVFNNMPFNAPRSLSPSQYAELLAFLLASNCYPAGSKPFPTADDPAFAQLKLGPVPGPHPNANQFGVCPTG